jgi:hypothetical protein
VSTRTRTLVRLSLARCGLGVLLVALFFLHDASVGAAAVEIVVGALGVVRRHIRVACVGDEILQSRRLFAAERLSRERPEPSAKEFGPGEPGFFRQILEQGAVALAEIDDGLFADSLGRC